MSAGVIEQDIKQKILDLGRNPDEDAGVFSALISAPYAHPVWRDYWLYVCHLRPIFRGDVEIEAIMYLPDATHKMWLYALDPAHTLEEHAAMPRIPAVLMPVNFSAQLVRDSDEAVVEEMRKLAEEPF